MRVEHHLVCGELYEAERRAFVDLLAGLSGDDLARTVVATPLWSVQDVLAHVIGVAADLNRQDFGGSGTSDEWTARQVESRRGRTVAELAAEWDAEAPLFEDGLALFGYDLGAHYVSDLVQHVADVQGTLQVGEPPSADAVVASLDFLFESFDETVHEAALGGVRVSLPDVDWVFGPNPVVATVTASPWEVMRALAGRRDLAQIRALDWQGSADAIDALVPRFSRYDQPPGPITDLR